MVSIVITAYNVAEYIETAIQSALAQTFTDIEVIIVLDKPTDGTSQIVKSLAETDERIRVIDNFENVGAGLSRRYGISAAKGEYVLLLDGDDFLGDNFIEALYHKAEETGADIVSGGIEVLHEDGSRDLTYYGENVTEGYDKVTKFWKERIVFMNNKLIRKTLHDKVPYCDRRYIEDTPVIIPQLYLANKVAYVDNSGYIYRMRKGSLTHSTNRIKDVIFKGLCWCDLVEFFNANDPKFLEAFPLHKYVINTFEVLNSLTFTPDNLNPYACEWAELMMRLLNLVKITGIDFKQKPPLK